MTLLCHKVLSVLLNLGLAVFEMRFLKLGHLNNINEGPCPSSMSNDFIFMGDGDGYCAVELLLFACCHCH